MLKCSSCSMVVNLGLRCQYCGNINIEETKRLKYIGIAGPLGSGKSTAAKIICEQITPSRIIPFAKRVKEIAKTMGWNGEKDEHGRRLLQLIGTECGRECIGENIWIDHWLEATKHTIDETLVVVDDVRFSNEMNIIEQLGGILIKIRGRNEVKDPSHASEKGLPDKSFDFVIKNSKDLFYLREKISEVLQHGRP